MSTSICVFIYSYAYMYMHNTQKDIGIRILAGLRHQSYQSKISFGPPDLKSVPTENAILEAQASKSSINCSKLR